jgi:hypothetical protein
MASLLTNVPRNVTRCLIRTNISRTMAVSRTLFSTKKHQNKINKYNNTTSPKRLQISVPSAFTKIFKSTYSTATADEITESWNNTELKDYGVILYKVPKEFHFLPPNQPKPEYVMSTVQITDFKSFDLGTRIVGWLKHAPPTDRDENILIEPNNFIENPSFRNFLTHVLVTYHTESESLKEQAKSTKHGLMQITDLRSRAAHRPATDDILGTIEVKDGIMQPATFEIMPIHRLVTRDGLFRLPHDMLDYLKDTKPIIGIDTFI